MRDKPRIFVALVVAIAAAGLPLWYAWSAPQSAPPELQLPSGHARCVEDVQYMRAHHMQLLNEWRNSVVREGQTTYVSKAYGQTYSKSLTKTCMACHANRRTFCDRCHTYANVRVGCWDCHLDGKGS